MNHHWIHRPYLRKYTFLDFLKRRVAKERIKLNVVSWELYLQVFGYDKKTPKHVFIQMIFLFLIQNLFPLDNNGWKAGEVWNLKTSIFMFKGFDITKQCIRIMKGVIHVPKLK